MPDVPWDLHRDEAGARSGHRDEAIEREQRLARLATRQHRAVGHDQMVVLGFGRGAIGRRLRAGRIWRIHRGVYAIGPGPLDQIGRWYAALLACRPAPALSHLSAAAESGLAREVGGVHVTIARHNGPALGGVTVHCARCLDPLDLSRGANGLPVTALHRTFLDLAETLPFERLETVFEEADRRDLLDFAAIRACMSRNRGRRGLRPLRMLVDDYLPVGNAKAGLERPFQRLVAEEGFPEPLTNILVCGLLVDCYWPDYRLVVELDSRAFHSHWRQQERDRARDGTLLRAGIACLRVTDRRLAHEREELIGDLASVLPRGRSRRPLR
jgi:Protein of unknown function (DUF559)